MSLEYTGRGLVPRLASERLTELAGHTRVVMVSGPRQSGKTTLLREYLATVGGSYRTLDQADTLRAARDDPAAFVAHGDTPRAIDEVQLGGDDLVRAIKVAVDTDPRPSRFILSGSSRFLTIPTLSESLAGRRAGSVGVLTDLAQGVELTRDTTRNYLSYLDMVYLTTSLPAWSTNMTSRLTKHPKLYPTDSGLAAHLLGVDAHSLAESGHPSLGPLVETFTATELLKATAHHEQRIDLFHLRTADKREIDFVLEDRRGRIVAVAVKASSSPRADALSGLRWLRQTLGSKLHAGVLLHLGTESASRGDRLYSLPISVLWGHHPLV